MWNYTTGICSPIITNAVLRIHTLRIRTRVSVLKSLDTIVNYGLEGEPKVLESSAFNCASGATPYPLLSSNIQPVKNIKPTYIILLTITEGGV